VPCHVSHQGPKIFTTFFELFRYYSVATCTVHHQLTLPSPLPFVTRRGGGRGEEQSNSYSGALDYEQSSAQGCYSMLKVLGGCNLKRMLSLFL